MPTVAREIEVSKEVSIGGFQGFFLIAGPCVIESEDHAFKLAAEIKRICDEVCIPFIFKASFDKANRSSVSSYRGPGLEEGLRILNQIKKDLIIPVLSDVHEVWQVEKAAEVLNVIQIPAFLCRQTDLLTAAARTKRVLNIKKGQFLAPYDMHNVVDKIVSQDNEDIILTERGTSFGYQNLIFDVRSVPIMKKLGFPVCIDASHSVQKPGAAGDASGGDAEFIPHIAGAGISAGADGVFLEIHDKPGKAKSDAYNSLNLKELKSLLDFLHRIRRAVVRRGC
jgi:2-dehydro-3-deoxyphosphooctonate aldolase (KDO 8-P synthase)